jgi:hypothetical protein
MTDKPHMALESTSMPKRELNSTELETVAGGGGNSAAPANGHMYLVFNFKLVAVKTIS